MLEAARQTARGLAAELGRGRRRSLQTIISAIEAYTAIDVVTYLQFDLPLTNPIWGQFRKFTTLKIYSSVETSVEVRYNTNLSADWRRFVVCKEMCHALEADEGTHSNTTRAIDRIMSRFALYSASKPTGKPFPAFDAETLAEVAALEIMCPLEVRRELVDTKSAQDLCDDFGIPVDYAEIAFGKEYIDIVEGL